MALIRNLALVAALAASACATVDPPPDNLPGETMVYEPTSGPFCFDDCTAIKITAAADGRVWAYKVDGIDGRSAP